MVAWLYLKSIFVYGSEIWGIETLNGKSIEKLMKSINNAIIEKLNLSICRHTLGVHRKAQVSAVLGELGRYPLA